MPAATLDRQISKSKHSREKLCVNYGKALSQGTPSKQPAEAAVVGRDPITARRNCGLYNEFLKLEQACIAFWRPDGRGSRRVSPGAGLCAILQPLYLSQLRFAARGIVASPFKTPWTRCFVKAIKGSNQRHGGAKCGFDVQMAGVEHTGVGRGAQGGGRPALIPLVANPHIVQHRFERRRLAPAEQLHEAPPRPDLGRRGDEELHVRLRTDHGSRVAPVQDGARKACGRTRAASPNSAARTRGCGTTRDAPSPTARDERAGSSEVGPSPILRFQAPGGRRRRGLVVERSAIGEHVARHGAIEAPGVEMG